MQGGIFSNSVVPQSLYDRVSLLEQNEYKVAYFATVNSGTGTVPIPTGATILLDQFTEGVDALASTILGGLPNMLSPITGTGAIVGVATFDSLGNYTLTGTPSAFPIAIVYVLKVNGANWYNLTNANIIEWQEHKYTGSSNISVNDNTRQISISDAELLALAGLASAADKLPYFTGLGTAALTTLTAFVRTLLDDADAATARSTLGLTIGTDIVAYSDPRLSDARNRKIYAYQNADSTITGTTSETILCSLACPIMGANDRMMVHSRVGAVGTTNAKTFRMYIGPNNNSLTGAVQIAAVSFSATQLSGAIDRRFVNKNNVALNSVFPITQNSASDANLSTVARTVTNIDTSTQQYLIITGQLSNVADTARLEDVQISWDKA